MSHVNRKSATRPTTLLSWQEALAIIESCDARGVPIPFAIAFCTADEDKGTGGEIIRYEKAVWHVNGGRVTKTEQFEQVGPKKKAKRTLKAKWTRLIRAVGSDQLRKIHLHLILEVNGQSVR
ncbi:hypothetical protein [Spirosoma oryzicola]|uniref:hypothetical protein n=1 Tax=Spirosoma oryzicola TaxID=2898794 RepID=UPI001E429CB4|nr:hypothetical protein [Spirosoma oryzicola]UHG93440.1 hypothetical protein LQ777_11160 [Spirosoma oryzicola]